MSTLHDDLSALTADQPFQPPDRLVAVTRKARRLRRTRVAVAAAAALAVAAPAGLLLTRHPASAPTSYASRAVTSWPDRSQEGAKSIGAGAVAHWLEDQKLSARDLHWLYRGYVPLSQPDQDVAVAAFTADGQLVLGTAPRADIDRTGETTGRPGANSWSFRMVDVENAGPAFGLNLFARGNSYGPGYDEDTVFALADPSARTLRLHMTPLEGAVTHDGKQAETDSALTSSNGVFTGDLGLVTGPLFATAVDGHDNASAQHLLPVGEDQQLAYPPAPVLPAGPTFEASFGSSGQFGSGSNDHTLGFSVDTSAARSRIGVYLRCYGGGRIRVTVDDRLLAALGCDGNQVSAVSPALKRGTHAVYFNGERVQSYAVQTGAQR